MKAKFCLLIALLSILTINASCSKDEEKPKANAFRYNGVEQKINMVRYGWGGSKDAVRLSTAVSKEAFDPAKDIELHVKLGSEHLNIRGTKAVNADKIELKIKDEFYSTDQPNTKIEDGSIIIYLGSYDTAEIKIKVKLKYWREGMPAWGYLYFECYYKGGMEFIEHLAQV